MKSLLIRLEDDLAAQFASVCAQEGYSKTGLVARLIREFVAEADVSDPIRAAKAYGIDLSLIKANLRSSPSERLENHARTHTLTVALRKDRDDT
jgi:hypothetical protein